MNHEKIHNPHNLIPSDIVILDKGLANSSKVFIVKMTPQKMYSTVVPAFLKDPKPEDSWVVMTNRLSPIE